MESNHLGIDALHNGPHEPLVKGGEWGIKEVTVGKSLLSNG